MARRGIGRYRGGIEGAALLAALLVLFTVVGQLNPLRRPVIITDRLGPDNAELVSDYLARAAETLSAESPSADARANRWALLSLDTHESTADAYAAARGVRVAQVLFQVPIDRVQTPLVTYGVPGSERSVLASSSYAAMTLHGSMGEWDRQSQIDAVSELRLRAGCACVAGLVVRGTTDELTAATGRPGVRAVEALPADAVDGKFAVTALLPQFVDAVSPLPDDGEVPAA